MIEFTGNYEDLSTDKGFQFKFYCEHCQNGYMSPYETNAVGVFEEVLRGASSLFGGIFGQAADSAYHVNRAVGGARHDEALRNAVAAIRPRFVQCKRCGDWSCRDVCYNPSANLCKRCAPVAADEETAARAQFVQQQIHNDMNLEEERRVQAKSAQLAKACGHCGADTLGKKFCPECGQATASAPQNCRACGARSTPGSKFCGECGEKLA